MTRASVVLCRKTCSLELTGHADGYPDVCTAISTLVQALDGFMGNYPEAVEQIVTRRIESGRVSITVRGGEQVQAAFRLVGVGLARLEATCPRAIKMSYNDE